MTMLGLTSDHASRVTSMIGEKAIAMDFPSVELIGCRYDEATDDMPGHHAVPRDWREDVFGAMLKAVGCSIYGYPEENSPLVSAEVHYAEDDETRHFVIDTPLLTLRPYYWGDCRAIRRLPNFVYKPWSLEISWYKWPMRDAYANISLSDSDWRLMCETVERAVVEFHKCGVWPADIDGSPRMGEVDEVAWELRKQMGIIADQRNVLEDALYELWFDHSSESARDEAARLLAVGPYGPVDGLCSL